MKILQINSVCGIRSTGRIATDIHDVLKSNGHESIIAYGRYEPINCDYALKIGTKYDNYVHAAMTRVFDKHGFGSKQATEEFIKTVEKIDPDVIHLHNIHGYYINIEVLFDYLKSSEKPVVWTLHDCWAFTGHCVYFDYLGCNKWKLECCDCPQKKNYPSSVVDNSKDNFHKKKKLFTGLKNMTVVTPSNWLSGLVTESFLGEYDVKVINNGIDLCVFKKIESNFRKKHNIDDKLIILGVANGWGVRKGYDYFIKLAAEFKDDEVIVMVGLTDKQIKNIPDKIIGIARTNNIHELAEIYSAADIFVNPTLEDNFPTTNLEALACGTPVITFNTGGSVECIDNSCGLVAEKDDLNSLTDSIKQIKMKITENYPFECIERVRRSYDKKEKYKEYVDLYASVYKAK